MNTRESKHLRVFLVRFCTLRASSVTVEFPRRLGFVSEGGRRDAKSLTKIL